MTQPRDYIAIVDKRREKEKKEEKAGHMCTSYRSDTIIEITVNDRQGERRATFIQIYGGFTDSTSDYECTFRRNSSVFASHIEIFSIELAGRMNRRGGPSWN